MPYRLRPLDFIDDVWARDQSSTGCQAYITGYLTPNLILMRMMQIQLTIQCCIIMSIIINQIERRTQLAIVAIKPATSLSYRKQGGLAVQGSQRIPIRRWPRTSSPLITHSKYGGKSAIRVMQIKSQWRGTTTSGCSHIQRSSYSRTWVGR